MLYFLPMDAPDYFIPDHDPPAFYPLREFVRAPSVSAAKKYIEALTAPGDLVVDPFGATPNVAFAAHTLGRRAIVVESNPLWAWLARALVTLPEESEINAALTKLGDALKDETPLRAHIAQLYATRCAACGKATPVDYFVHARERGAVRRHYTCAHCNATRDDETTEEDTQRTLSFDEHGLHYHVAFERVALEDGSFADRINKMLDLYTPRNLYALVTLTQKIDSLFRESRERNILFLLLLHLLGRGMSLYKSPDATAQLKTHPQFIEFNLWREIEIAARALAQDAQPLPLADSIADVINADSPRVFVGRGNAQSLAREIPPRSVALILSAQPTRRVGLLALSYFWGAWILGRNFAEPLAGFLDPKKDFTWELRRYTELLGETLTPVGNLMDASARVVFAFAESSHLAIEALLTAGADAKLNLDSFLFQPRVGESARSEYGDLPGSYQLVMSKSKRIAENGDRELPSDDARAIWRAAPTSSVNAAQLEKTIRASALEAGKEILARRGEALAYSWVHHAAYARITREGLLAQSLEAKLKIPLSRFAHQAVVAGLSAGYAEDFDHYQTPTQFVWLRHAKLEPPLIDRVDDAVQAWLAKPGKLEELQDDIYRQFPGDLTPEAGLIDLCVQAHADAEHRNEEKARAIEKLAKLGERLGFQTAEFRQQTTDNRNTNLAFRNFDLAWLSDGEIVHGFIWRARAQFADLIQIHVAPACGYIIVPENVVALMQEKNRRLPLLADTFHEAGWHFVRVPFVEKLLRQEKIERHDLVFMTGLEPPSLDRGTQLELL